MREVRDVIALTGVRVQRMNAGSFHSGGRLVRGAEKGTLDFEGYDKHGRFLAIECKAGAGGRLSEAQARRIEDINAVGGVAFVVTSGEQCMRFLAERGCV